MGGHASLFRSHDTSCFRFQPLLTGYSLDTRPLARVEVWLRPTTKGPGDEVTATLSLSRTLQLGTGYCHPYVPQINMKYIHNSPRIVFRLPSLHVLMAHNTTNPVGSLSCTTEIETCFCHLDQMEWSDHLADIYNFRSQGLWFVAPLWDKLIEVSRSQLTLRAVHGPESKGQWDSLNVSSLSSTRYSAPSSMLRLSSGSIFWAAIEIWRALFKIINFYVGEVFSQATPRTFLPERTH